MGLIKKGEKNMNKSPISKRKYVATLMRVCFVVVVALVLPRFFFNDNRLYKAQSGSYYHDTGFKLGIENISKEFLQSLNIQGRLDGYRVGLITNHTGIDQQGKRSIDILIAHGLRIKKIYVPENDFHHFKKNNEWAMIDEATQIPLSLLAHIDSLKKAKEYAFSEIDVLFVDMQEPGITPNTYLATMMKVLQSAAAQNKTVVVLDRPNVLGSSMEGIAYENSKNGQEHVPVPMRSGMTIGELARYFNTSVLSKSANLFVVPMQKYDRVLFADAGARMCGALMTNIDTYHGSSFLQALSSVAPFDVGVGTDMAYHCLALPESLHVAKQKWFELRTILKEQGLETSWFNYFNPKKRVSYAGLRMLIGDIDNFSSFNTIVTIINFFKESGIKLTFGSEFDRTFGGKKMRDFLDGKISRHELEHEVNKGLKNFFAKAQPAFMYKPIPKIVFM
ncbi:hypothetical protein BH09DEP1_BH09DEP1_4360 [soil metagenome]